MDRLFLDANILFSAAYRPQDMPLPDKDRPILLAAIDAQATHLLTGDFRDFGPYYGHVVEGVLILPPGDYLRSRSS